MKAPTPNKLESEVKVPLFDVGKEKFLISVTAVTVAISTLKLNKAAKADQEKNLIPGVSHSTGTLGWS